MSSNSRITADRAVADYVAMGPQRSLKKLAQHYTETRMENGTLGNLRYWSRTHGWVRAAEEHDAQVAGEVSRKAIEAQAQERWDAARAMGDLWQGIADKLLAAVAKTEVVDATAFRAMTAAMKEVAELTDKVAQGEATPAQAQEAADGAADRLNVIELWEHRHGRP